MKICIDIKECEKEKISIDNILYLLSIYVDKAMSYTTFNDVCSKGFVTYDGFTQTREPVNIRLTPEGVEMVETILLNSEFKNTEKEEDRFEKLAEDLQNIYPKGKKPGTSQMWRDSKSIISKRLKAVIKKYNVKFTNEEAIEATRKYVNSFNGDYRYMQVLKYFICKRNNMTGEESSQLLSYIENKEDGDNIASEDWTSFIV